MVIFKIYLKRRIYIFLLGFAVISCSKNLYNNDEVIYIDTRWKKEALITLSKKYMRYKETHDLEKKINSEIDLYMKFDDINRYPYGIGIEKIKKEVENKKIRFDSIVCVTTQVIGIDPTMLYSNLYFIFKNGEIASGYEFYPETLEFRKSGMSLTELNNSYKYHIRQEDGDDMSLLVFTTFNPKLDFKISKITINYYPKIE